MKEGNLFRRYTSNCTTGQNSSTPMHIGIIDFILATAALGAALAVAAIGALGLVVWLAGGKVDRRKDHRTA